MKLKFLMLFIALINIQCYKDKKSQTLNVVKTEINDVAKAEVPKVADDFIVNATNTEVLVVNNSEIDRKELVDFAKNLLEVPYVYGTQDPKKGFDCSGFVNYVFKNFNITVPRSSSGFKNFGKKINVEDVKLGDVLVFNGYKDKTIIGHLGIVCEANGLNSKFIHASSGKVMGVTISDLNSDHYSKRFNHAVDVIDN
ncbi:C40 family peptidase [uncultured Flavobacterium sp.]|uniref:C40 family peptidase n=1 Tax=uncultured Flavobacterium sp. TaxID=165435 RepID=UPI0030EC3B45|tara:strand:- start:151586 stop:152176 length:591 start_codon:yes stop_codon:yes gene_type:complete